MINYAQFTPVSAMLGGALIGLSCLLLLLVNGRIAGISGITGQILNKPSRSNLWAWIFIAGLLAGAILGVRTMNIAPPVMDLSWINIITAGLLVGIGTKLGSGCTSGHGICGIGRFSKRSIVATCTFLISGIISLYLTK
ncbi:MAG: YeeE/YedE family protein [Oceanospirillaceae bacterium]|nr:YeeE/YedE family protein [Oceanospirillaceae bacterium]